MTDSPEATEITIDGVRVDDLCEVVITAPDPGWLASFVYGLIEDRLCAGSHIVEEISSIYPWHGQVHRVTEARAACRTRVALAPVIIERTRVAHPYEVPSVVVLPIIAANPDYTDWVRRSTRHQP